MVDVKKEGARTVKGIEECSKKGQKVKNTIALILHFSHQFL